MQAYYRNVALWLARASQRRSMSVAAVWTALTHNGPALGRGPERCETSGLSPCWVDELVNVQVNATSMALAQSTDTTIHGRRSGARARGPGPSGRRGSMSSTPATAMEVLGERTLLMTWVDAPPWNPSRAAVEDVPRLIRESLDGAIEGLEWLRNGVTEAEERWTGPATDGAGR